MKAQLFASALLLGAATLASANTAIVAGSDWQDDLLSAPGPTDGSDWTFSLAAGELASFKVTDCCVIGDTYQLFSGATLLATSSYFAGASTGSSSFYESYWTDASYSKIEYTFSGAGNYSFRIEGDGAGGIPAGLGVRLDVTAVPEPTTWALMLAGLGVAGIAARRKTATQGE